MKRKIISLLLAVAFCLSFTVLASAAAEETQLFDEADLLTEREEYELYEKLLEVSRTHDAQIIIATVDETTGGDINYMTESLYDSMGFGYGAAHDGVFLLVCMDIREYRILSNGYAGDAIGVREIDAISEAMVSDLSEGDYAAAFDVFVRRCDHYLTGYRTGYPFDLGTNLLIALAIGLAAGLITVMIMRSQLKSVRKQDQANVYMKSGSMRLTGSSDIFLYRNVSRTRRQTSSSSGSRSGGSRSIGGGSF